MILARIEIYVYYFFRKLYSRPYKKKSDDVTVLIIGQVGAWTMTSLIAYDKIYEDGLLNYLEQIGLPLVIFGAPTFLIYVGLYYLFKRKLPYKKKRKLVGNFPNWFVRMGDIIPFVVVLFSFGMFFYTMMFYQGPE